ncbi:uncharacterized protein LOC119182319 isoform X2 [Rhipicephalus microplus]|uniref:uncharacterized protein LOC119182319 isoform X2 n=1 Tax=Rhipicephalus microplus TaxID=6941 RepID=UPI003F6D8946
MSGLTTAQDAALQVLWCGDGPVTRASVSLWITKLLTGEPCSRHIQEHECFAERYQHTRTHESPGSSTLDVIYAIEEQEQVYFCLRCNTRTNHWH